MHRTTILVALAAIGLIVAATAAARMRPSVAIADPPPGTITASATPDGTTPTATPTPAAAPAPARGPGLMVAECRTPSDHGVRVIFLWTPSLAGSQWLDLSTSNDGFAPAMLVSSGALDRTMYGFVWDGLLQDATHYARINTLTSAGWLASDTLAFHTPACTAPAAPAADMLRLRDDIAAAVAEGGINTAVAITDLRTGETVDIEGADPRLPGCTINLFVLMRVVAGLQSGAYPEGDVGQDIGDTIHRSDPVIARRLMTERVGAGDLAVGIARVNDFTRSLGMDATLMDHPPAFPQESQFGLADNRITALDANRGLRAIWDGRVLLPGWRDYLLGKMTLVKPGLNYLIPSGVAGDATVSHKNGFLYSEGWADNDIGIVWFERGGQRYGYALSFFTENVASKYADIPMGQRISSLAWRWFAGRYGYP